MNSKSEFANKEKEKLKKTESALKIEENRDSKINLVNDSKASERVDDAKIKVTGESEIPNNTGRSGRTFSKELE